MTMMMMHDTQRCAATAHVPQPGPDVVPTPGQPHPMPPPEPVPPEIIEPPLPGEDWPIVEPDRPEPRRQ